MPESAHVPARPRARTRDRLGRHPLLQRPFSLPYYFHVCYTMCVLAFVRLRSCVRAHARVRAMRLRSDTTDRSGPALGEGRLQPGEALQPGGLLGLHESRARLMPSLAP